MLHKDKERVVAGLPSLLPEKRRAIELAARTRDVDRRNLQEHIGKDKFTTAPDGEVDVTNTLVQLGHPLSSQEFMKRLRVCNSNFIFEVSNADKTKYGIYIMQWNVDPTTNSGTYEKQFLVGFENGFMPEFSVRHYKEKLAPDPNMNGEWIKIKLFTKETRGWRTVLARLLRAGFITEPDIHKNFDFSRSSYNWAVLTGNRRV